MNVFLIRHDGKVTVFDGGIKAMTRYVAEAAASLGPLDRVVLGHSHAEHRGIAPGLGVPVWCHEDEADDARADGGAHYFHYERLRGFRSRWLIPVFVRLWDGGPVDVADTVKEGDRVAGFEVVHFPGHAPGLIGLWRESDRLALVSDTVYTMDPETGRFGEPRLPHRAFSKDMDQTRRSAYKLADLDPRVVWTGHGDAVTGNVREQLRRAAAA
jgi:glyoxylase-like metal-dependent hydrolase (beta-lactamase superfamily II)